MPKMSKKAFDLIPAEVDRRIYVQLIETLKIVFVLKNVKILFKSLRLFIYE